MTARLWPVLLIAIGLGILVARGPFELIGGLLSAGLIGLFVGAGLAGGIGAIGCVGGGNAATVFPTSVGDLWDAGSRGRQRRLRNSQPDHHSGLGLEPVRDR